MKDLTKLTDKALDRLADKAIGKTEELGQKVFLSVLDQTKPVNTTASPWYGYEYTPEADFDSLEVGDLIAYADWSSRHGDRIRPYQSREASPAEFAASWSTRIGVVVSRTAKRISVAVVSSQWNWAVPVDLAYEDRYVETFGDSAYRTVVHLGKHADVVKAIVESPGGALWAKNLADTWALVKEDTRRRDVRQAQLDVKVEGIEQSVQWLNTALGFDVFYVNTYTGEIERDSEWEFVPREALRLILKARDVPGVAQFTAELDRVDTREEG